MKELRLLVTNGCNYNCFFCHHEGLQEKQQTPIFTAEDYAYLYKAFKELYQSNEITVTGGEPLVRNDIIEILQGLKNAQAQTTLVSNGSLLESFTDVAKYVNRINISLHSLNPNVYSSIVNSNPNALSKVIAGIQKVVSKHPKTQIRFNTTILKGVNDDANSIGEIIDFAQDVHASVKFIELYPSSTTGFVSLNDIGNTLETHHQFKKIVENNRQTIYSRNNNAVTAILTRIFCAHAITTENSSKYCQEHQDLFITPDGGIKTCMNTPNKVSIAQAVHQRNLKQLSHKFMSAISEMGQYCK